MFNGHLLFLLLLPILTNRYDTKWYDDGGIDVGCNQAILASSADKVIHKRLEDHKLSAYSFQV